MRPRVKRVLVVFIVANMLHTFLPMVNRRLTLQPSLPPLLFTILHPFIMIIIKGYFYATNRCIKFRTPFSPTATSSPPASLPDSSSTFGKKVQPLTKFPKLKIVRRGSTNHHRFPFLPTDLAHQSLPDKAVVLLWRVQNQARRCDSLRTCVDSS